MMKRIVAILLLVVIGLSLVACAPKECGICKTEGEKLTKVTYKGDTEWLCPTCNALFELGKSLGY